MKPLDKELEHLKQFRLRSWAKLIGRLKKQSNEYIEDELVSRGFGHFKIGYMPLLMNIDPEGITNNELSKRASITKQAMSKIVNELVELKYITTKPHGEDGRSSIVFLTENGKKFVIGAKNCMMTLMDEYRLLLGKKEFEHLLDMLTRIMEYNEKRVGKE